MSCDMSRELEVLHLLEGCSLKLRRPHGEMYIHGKAASSCSIGESGYPVYPTVDSVIVTCKHDTSVYEHQYRR